LRGLGCEADKNVHAPDWLADDGLFSVWADADVGDGCAGEFFNAGKVVLGELWKFIVGAALGGVFFPAGDLLVNGGDVIPVLALGGWELVNLAIDVVADTDFDGLALVKAIENGDGEISDAIDHDGVADEDGIEPATTSWAASGGSKFHATAVEELGDVIVLSRERTGANTGGVGFANADDAVDGVGWHS